MEKETEGCVNQAFESTEDGFHTIDLRKTKNEAKELEELNKVIFLI